MAHYNPRIYRGEEAAPLLVPKELFTNERYKGLSSDAKILYSLLLDRIHLASENGWIDEHGQIFVIYTRREMGEMLNLSDKTVTRVLRQLQDAELIMEKRQGLNKPNKIYPMKLNHSPLSVVGAEAGEGEGR